MISRKGDFGYVIDDGVDFSGLDPSAWELGVDRVHLKIN